MESQPGLGSAGARANFPIWKVIPEFGPQGLRATFLPIRGLALGVACRGQTNAPNRFEKTLRFPAVACCPRQTKPTQVWKKARVFKISFPNQCTKTYCCPAQLSNLEGKPELGHARARANFPIRKDSPGLGQPEAGLTFLFEKVGPDLGPQGPGLISSVGKVSPEFGPQEPWPTFQHLEE